MTFNLKSMSRKELTKLKGDVAKALKSAEDRERRAALKAAEKAAAKFGFSLDDISGGAKKAKPTKKRRTTKTVKAAPKYRNPANAEQTWSGRGRKPQWIHQALIEGADITDLEI